MNKSRTVFLVFIIVLGVIGIIEQIESWSWQSFVTGFVCGLPIATCWLRLKWLSVLLVFLLVGGFILVELLGIGSLSPDRLMFSGALFGTLFGFWPSYLLNKPVSIIFVRDWLEQDGYQKAALYFEKKLMKYNPKKYRAENRYWKKPSSASNPNQLNT